MFKNFTSKGGLPFCAHINSNNYEDDNNNDDNDNNNIGSNNNDVNNNNDDHNNNDDADEEDKMINWTIKITNDLSRASL